MTSTVTNYSKSALRTVKNYTKGYSDVQTKVRAATSNDPWGPSGTQMNEIAQYTYNQQDFVEIMEMLDKRLNDKGKNWRHTFKALTVLDYCLHAGSENVVLYFRENLYIIKTLKDFVYIDEDGKDQGANVRQKAKDITNLLQDESRLRDERRTRSNMRERMSGRSGSGDEDRAPPPRARSAPPARRNEDDDLQRALEASKRSAEEESNRKRGDADLEEALRLSREEDERRRKELEAAKNSLFDQDAQNQLIDLNSQGPYQPQPQFSAYNPYADAQAALQRQQEEEYMQMQMQQQQQMEYQRQLDLQRQQQEYQQMLQQQAMQQQMYLQSQQTGFQPQPLVPQPTAFGSNNPFAQFANSSTSSSQTPPPQRITSQPTIDLPGTFASSSSSSRLSPQPSRSPAPVAAVRPPRDDGQHSKLAALIGNREDGIDTFGNVGSHRVPVGSPFAAGRLAASNTGPAALQQNQHTGFGQVSGAPARGHFDAHQQQNNSSQPFFEI